VSNEPLQDLLVVQGHDTRLDQLRHHLDVLPARIDRDAAAAALGATEVEQATVTGQRDDLARDQKRLDDEVESLGAKRAGHDQRLYSGSVTVPRELQDMQDEIAALGRRITVLEDRELEIMEAREPVDARLAELEAALVNRRLALVEAEQHLTVSEAELAVAFQTETDQRAVAAALVPTDLLLSYEKLRAGMGGVAVARLEGSQCGGCHLTLAAMETARLRKLPVGEVAHCEECGRILVP
jgi:predicted  nucleic acid-binding Zn-ribbon protein